ncbi:uncharacterized protein MELLADRAFT_92747 [Melampsora larici-populina 98AG31]|uniref:Uncharacterized protein n=1 Tax=Melampsora larici-populina (strain 98AG31 / pathotype 3-4-7) TaxID=747676 RepID=F4S2L5_MELLP|nr:uncharacterized protein MELLADRAFT_92747 [Melampsora larici-populina 98AG31]EGG01111.1 hypothetical protein MELLADRAFT_92747 [Melampsora larici-populina 98AG31]
MISIKNVCCYQFVQEAKRVAGQGIILQCLIDSCPGRYITILDSFDHSYLEPEVVSNLLDLRLIGKAWAIAVIPHVYRSIRLTSHFMINTLSRRLDDSFLVSNMARFRALSFDCLLYPDIDVISTRANHLKPTLGSRLDPRNHLINTNSSLMRHVANIIQVSAPTLTDQSFRFKGTVGFRSGIIAAVHQVHNLEVLNIIGLTASNMSDNSNSLKSLLDATVNLRSMSLQIGSMDRLDLARGSLSQLEHLAASCSPANYDAIVGVCENQGTNIKCLEYKHNFHNHETALMILAVRQSVEVLLTDVTPGSNPINVHDLDFPNLRIIRLTCSNTMGKDLNWLHSKFFEHMQVLVTGYHISVGYWRRVLKCKYSTSVTLPVNFKHIVFLTYDGRTKDPAIVKCFKEYNITCHFSYVGGYHELLDILRSSGNQDD